jgi:hypothetical protein
MSTVRLFLLWKSRRLQHLFERFALGAWQSDAQEPRRGGSHIEIRDFAQRGQEAEAFAAQRVLGIFPALVDDLAPAHASAGELQPRGD